jgi:hypothetical protein
VGVDVGVAVGSSVGVDVGPCSRARALQDTSSDCSQTNQSRRLLTAVGYSVG